MYPPSARVHWFLCIVAVMGLVGLHICEELNYLSRAFSGEEIS